MLKFYCEKYFRKFGIMPIRIGKTDRFKVREKEMIAREIENALWPNWHKPMTENVKKRLRDASIIRNAVEKRAKELNRKEKQIERKIQDK